MVKATYFVVKLDAHPSASEVAIAGPFANTREALAMIALYQERQYYEPDTLLYPCAKSHAVKISLYDKDWQVRTEYMLKDVDFHEDQRARWDLLRIENGRPHPVR